VGEKITDDVIMEEGDTVEGAIGSCTSFGHQNMDMRMEIDAISEGLNHHHHSRHELQACDCVQIFHKYTHCTETERIDVRDVAVYTIIGINLDGHKECLGMWVCETESAKYWLSVLNELKNRGLEDVLIFSVDNLKGISEAIEAVFPQAEVQWLCCAMNIPLRMERLLPKDSKGWALAKSSAPGPGVAKYG
jgi:hypothetical protein